MEVIREPNTVSDHIKTFLDDHEWPEHVKDPQLTEANQEANFFEYMIIIILENLLVSYRCFLE
jgi:hypothetical protein